MNTMIHTTNTTASRIANAKSTESFRAPHYDCQQHADAMKLTVYVPGVAASGMDITMRGPDLTITARKERFVRANWQALHLERAQLDYKLLLRIGTGYDPEAMTAELDDGVLTLTLPRRVASRQFAPEAVAAARLAHAAAA